MSCHPVPNELVNESSDIEQLQSTITTIKAMGVQNYGYYLGSTLTHTDSGILQMAKEILSRGTQ